MTHIDAIGIDGEADCLADFIEEANMRGLTAWKDAMGNQAPWSTTGSINQGLHVDESTRQLYRTGKLNARIAYNNMSDAYSLTNPALAHSLAALENAIGFEGDDKLRYLGPGEDFMATQGQDYIDYVKFAAGKRLSVETHVGGLDRQHPQRAWSRPTRSTRSASSSGRSRTRTRPRRPTRSSTARRRSASAGR